MKTLSKTELQNIVSGTKMGSPVTGACGDEPLPGTPEHSAWEECMRNGYTSGSGGGNTDGVCDPN